MSKGRFRRGLVVQQLKSNESVEKEGWLFELHGVRFGMTKERKGNQTFWDVTELSTGRIFCGHPLATQTRDKAFQFVEKRFEAYGVDGIRKIIVDLGGVVNSIESEDGK